MRKLLAPALGLSLLFPAAANAEMAPTVKTPAAELRSGLDYLLSEHFVLAVDAMTKEYDGAKDAEHAQKALEKNAEDMKPAIASLYGDKAAEQFNSIFAPHNDYTEEYVEAVKAKDPNAKKEAMEKVEKFTEEFGSFLSTATSGKLPADAAKEALKAHEMDVQKTFDDYVKGDYQAEFTSFREGYSRMFTISKVLSGAIVSQMPEKFKNTRADSKAADLRSTLSSLAAEHFALASMSMERGYNGAKDFDAAKWAENEHTADFKAAIVSLYGKQGGDAFEKIWTTDHINAQNDLVMAAMNKDDKGVQDAKDRMISFSSEFGDFLSTATGGKLPAQAAKDAVKMHEQQVIKNFEDYMTGDYASEYASFDEGYKFMFGVGETLGGAIVQQMPDKFMGSAMPSDMPKTGFGGASQTDSSANNWLLLSGGSLAALAAVFGIRKRLNVQK
ncbi:LPXTG cell wall anchor domain-containing protein [Metabacillus sp. GX 13764]|uniref:LPXTG cell wall anchor domain-containing protein n=1 Tax=Metabacillus kandeliae TaxID=2900151 RepID=UPI001E5E5D3A|nr:LPXTG cell wall anchor domain-containing protein [Metabacillus kandeliae]MCD7034872.1 LPXTG cell wall anchor domain-containing protein [Metabacillus kandeliae]